MDFSLSPCTRVLLGSIALRFGIALVQKEDITTIKKHDLSLYGALDLRFYMEKDNTLVLRLMLDGWC